MQIIPIAGKGSRFKSAGYKTSKYLLPVSSKPIIENILSYFDKTKPTLLILNEHDSNKEQIERILKDLYYEDFEVVEISETNGQLTSVVNGVKASKFKDHDGPAWIYNGDTIRKKELPYSLLINNDSDGFIEVFKEKGSHWSFVDKLDRISSIAEKDRISDYCCTGLYGFKSLPRLIEYFETNRVEKQRDELYVSGVYRSYINDDLKVWAFESSREDFLLCGTPIEYQEVLASFKK